MTHRAESLEKNKAGGPLGAQRRRGTCGEQEQLWAEDSNSRRAKRPKKSVSECLVCVGGGVPCPVAAPLRAKPGWRAPTQIQ